MPVVALGAFQSAAELLRLQTKALSAESTSSACIAAAPARWASTCESSSMRACAWISGRQPNRSASGRRAYASTYARLVYGHARVETEPAAGTPRIEGVVHTLSRTVWKHSLPADVGALDDDPACSVALLCVREPTAWLLATAAVVPEIAHARVNSPSSLLELSLRASGASRANWCEPGRLPRAAATVCRSTRTKCSPSSRHGGIFI